MSTTYSFNVYTGELQTSASTFPIRLTFGNQTITPLVVDFSLKSDPVLEKKLYIQGGPGKSTYAPAQRKISGSFKFPIRVTEGKELDDAILFFINYTFFDQGNSCTPLAIKFFELETGYFKTAQGYFVTPGYSDQAYNSEFIQIKINRCIVTNFKIESDVDSDMYLTIEFVGTVRKSVVDMLFEERSEITTVKSSFEIDRVLSLHDCKLLMNGSYVPNCKSLSFNITREVVEKNFSRSFNVDYSSVFPGIAIVDPVLNYSNDMSSKIGVKSFESSIAIKQVLRKIDEDLYFSRGGVAKIFSNFSSNFIELYFGPIKIARTCALAQQSEQPFSIGVIERGTTFDLLNKPKVIKEDFISVITGGGW